MSFRWKNEESHLKIKNAGPGGFSAKWRRHSQRQTDPAFELVV